MIIIKTFEINNVYSSVNIFFICLIYRIGMAKHKREEFKMNVKNICFILGICLILLSVGSVSAFNETKTYDFDLVNDDPVQQIDVECNDTVTVNAKTAEVNVYSTKVSASSIYNNGGETETIYLTVGEVDENGNIKNSNYTYNSAYVEGCKISMNYKFKPLTTYKIQYYTASSAYGVYHGITYDSASYTKMLYEGVFTTNQYGEGGELSTIINYTTRIRNGQDAQFLDLSLLNRIGYNFKIIYHKTPIYTYYNYTDTKIIKSTVLDKTFKKVKLFKSEYKLFKKMIKGKSFNPYKFSKIIKVKNYKLDKTYSYKILNLKKLSKKYNVAEGKKEVRYKFTVKRYHTISKTVKTPCTGSYLNCYI